VRSHDPRLIYAKARLDRLRLYPTQVRIDRVRLFVTPWLFRLPWFRRFDGYALHETILVRSAHASEDLVTHELCHVWQMQHRPVHVVATYLTTRYRKNPYELEARRAVDLTR
jgi:hypothetical protein